VGRQARRAPEELVHVVVILAILVIGRGGHVALQYHVDRSHDVVEEMSWVEGALEFRRGLEKEEEIFVSSNIYIHTHTTSHTHTFTHSLTHSLNSLTHSTHSLNSLTQLTHSPEKN